MNQTPLSQQHHQPKHPVVRASCSQSRHRKTFKSTATATQWRPDCYTWLSACCTGPWTNQVALVLNEELKSDKCSNSWMKPINKCGNKVKIQITPRLIYRISQCLSSEYTTKHTHWQSVFARVLCWRCSSASWCERHGSKAPCTFAAESGTFNLMRPCTAWFIYSKIHVAGTRAVCH